MATILTNVGTMLTSIVGWVVSTLNSLVADPYFQFVILLAVATVIIGIIFKVFKAFGLKRGSKRRGR